MLLEVLLDPLQRLMVLLLFLCLYIFLIAVAWDGLRLFGCDGEADPDHKLLALLVLVQGEVQLDNSAIKFFVAHMTKGESDYMLTIETHTKMGLSSLQY